jgi:phage-related protein
VGKARRHTTSWTDQRIKVLSEVLAGIASVKAFVWEEPFKVRSHSTLWQSLDSAGRRDFAPFSPLPCLFMS